MAEWYARADTERLIKDQGQRLDVKHQATNPVAKYKPQCTEHDVPGTLYEIRSKAPGAFQHLRLDGLRQAVVSAVKASYKTVL
jgi:hypothetical protein